MYDTFIAYVPESGKVTLRAAKVPSPGPGQLLLEARYSTLSPGTEHSLLAGDILPLPQDLGYSLAARVVEVGEGVEQFSPGDAVVATAAHARYQLIDQRAVTPVPEGTDLEQAAFFNLAHTAMYAIRRSGLQLGESCVVLGQGLVGAITAQLARLAGALPVIVTDLNESRLEVSRRMGVHQALNPGSDDARVANLVTELAGGVAVVFEATGARQPLHQAFDLVAERGRVVMMSQSHSSALPDFCHHLFSKGACLIGGYINSKPFSLYRTDLEITDNWPPVMRSDMARYSDRECWTSDGDIRVILRLLRDGGLNLAPLISHRFDWQQLPRAYQLVWKRDPSLLGGVIRWQD